MAKQEKIELRISDPNRQLKPEDLDISDIKELMDDMLNLIAPSKSDKLQRPKVSYALVSGSILHSFSTDVSVVAKLNDSLGAVASRNSLEPLAYKQQQVIDKFQQQATKNGLSISLGTSIDTSTKVEIDSQTKFYRIDTKSYQSEFHIYGEIYQVGGKKPYINISTKDYGNLTVSATKKQILSGEKRVYTNCGMLVSGKKTLDERIDGELKLIKFIAHNPVFDEELLMRMQARATPNLNKIEHLDSLLDQIRGTVGG